MKADGTVVAVGSNDSGQCDVGDWRDIVAISVGGMADNHKMSFEHHCHTIGLKADGTVVGVGEYTGSQFVVPDWTNIAAICAGAGHTVGLKTDGTVVAVGGTYAGACDVSGFRDIKVNTH